MKKMLSSIRKCEWEVLRVSNEGRQLHVSWILSLKCSSIKHSGWVIFLINNFSFFESSVTLLRSNLLIIHPLIFVYLTVTCSFRLSQFDFQSFISINNQLEGQCHQNLFKQTHELENCLKFSLIFCIFGIIEI